MKFREFGQMKLTTKMSLLVSAVTLAVLLINTVAVGYENIMTTESGLEERVREVAHITAVSPTVISGLSGRGPVNEIQTYANKLMRLSGVQFVVVADMKGDRKSHPNSSILERQIVGGDFEAALHGREYISHARGTLGNSLRAYVPVYDDAGKQIGIVLVGILMTNVDAAMKRCVVSLLPGLCLGLSVGLAGAFLLSKSIKKILFGMEPYEIAKTFEEKNAMLASIREGVLAVDKDGVINLVNTESRKIFTKAGITEDLVGKLAVDFIPNTRMPEVLKTGEREFDREQNVNGVNLITNRVPIVIGGKIEGVIATFRDRTEMKVMAERLTQINQYAESLRAQTHEFMNKLHVIMGMVHLKYYDELTEYIKEIAGNYHMEVGLVVRCVKDKALAGFLLGQMSYCRENKTTLLLSEDTFVPEPVAPEMSHEVISILGNILNNAVDALRNEKEKTVFLEMIYRARTLNLKVCNTGPNIRNAEQIFEKGFSTKGPGRGYGLFAVRTAISRLGGRIRVTSDKKYGAIFQISLPYERKQGG